MHKNSLFYGINMVLLPIVMQEWCELSVKGLKNGLAEKSERRTNFFSVASRASSNHLAYHRDLLFLLTLSMEIKEHNLVLDLGEWPIVTEYWFQF